MIGLFFEVQTRPGHRDQYLNLAASLKPELEAMGGCLFIDRFRSLTRENVLLSYQIWQDEGALTARTRGVNGARGDLFASTGFP